MNTIFSDPRVVVGHDGKLYLRFATDFAAELFLDSLGASRRETHCCDGYANGIEIVTHNHGLWAA